MIAETIIHACRECGSTNIVKNGRNTYDNQQYWCKACGKRAVLRPKPKGYREAEKEQILSAYNERSSMRGIQRTSGVSRNTLTTWLKKRRTKSKN